MQKFFEKGRKFFGNYETFCNFGSLVIWENENSIRKWCNMKVERKTKKGGEKIEKNL